MTKFMIKLAKISGVSILIPTCSKCISMLPKEAFCSILVPRRTPPLVLSRALSVLDIDPHTSITLVTSDEISGAASNNRSREIN